MATKLMFFGAIACLLVHAAVGKGYATTGLSEAQQCRLQRIRATKPTERFEHEAGVTEHWDEEEEQFQCAGVIAMRNVLRQNALWLPQFLSSPRLLYIEQGSGLLGIIYPGCPDTFHSGEPSGSMQGSMSQERGGQGQGEWGEGDQHQKVHRVRRGDIVAIPEGVVHWSYNDGNEELVFVSVIDVNNQNNQLDPRLRAFFLAGGHRGQGQQSRSHFQNIFRGLDTELLAESYNIPTEVAQRLQRDDGRGFMVYAAKKLRVISPEEENDEEYEQEQEEKMQRGRGSPSNGLEETFCTMKIKQSVDSPRAADVFSRQAGRVNIVNMYKLPMLRFIDMSAEGGHLLPNAIYSPQWSLTDNRVVYVIRGDAQVQIVDQNGEAVLDESVNEGQMFVIPQFYVTVARAGKKGFDWITFKTSAEPMKSPLVGSSSVFRALPIEVITNSYQMSPREAQQVKYNREGQTFLLSPSRQSHRLE